MACRNICPQNAIGYGTDTNSKLVPFVDEKLCVNCGACQKICPNNTDAEYNKSYKCYAAYNIDGADCTESSSAGVSHALCTYIVQNGGTVFGAAYSDGKLIHKSARSLEDILPFRGSKYVQSDTGFSYRKVKEELQNGQLVLYTGTPCQIAGLNSFLNKDYPNLITIDLICHGVPSAKLLDDYLKDNGVNTYVNISFRQGDEYNLTVYGNDNEVLFKKNAAFDPYYRAFYNNITLRDNCYECPWATAYNRPADISIGDFWKIDKSSLKCKPDGKVSLVLINSKKGGEFWNKLSINCEERSLNEAIEGNAQLRAPSKKNADTDKFYRNYSKGFTYAVNKTCVKRNIRRNKIGSFKESLKGIIKKGLKL